MQKWMDKWLEKIYNEAERLDWAEAYTHAEEVVSSSEEDKLKLNFLKRLYYRMSRWVQPCEFGQIRIDNRADNSYIKFYNYDFKQYKWAIENHLDDQLDNNYFLVPYEKFSKETLKKLQEKAVNSYAA